jgi:ribosomal protein L32
MPCYRCGVRQTDPVRGASPWRRGVRREVQVLICPACQREHDPELDHCGSCGSTMLICRLGEVECRSCGSVRLAHSAEAESGPSLVKAGAPGLSEEVEAALRRVLGRQPAS